MEYRDVLFHDLDAGITICDGRFNHMRDPTMQIEQMKHFRLRFVLEIFERLNFSKTLNK